MSEITTHGRFLHLLPDWRDECVAIIAAGQSVKDHDLSKLRGRIHVVAINNSVQLVPWADAIYSCDAPWWQVHGGLRDFKGLKITQDAMAAGMFPDLIRISVPGNDDELKLERKGTVGSGANSGFQCLNLMVQCGVRGIALFGFDFCGEHWHGRHLPPLQNPDQYTCFNRWTKSLNDAAPTLARLDVDVVNCSQISTVHAFPKMGLVDMLNRWGL